MSLWPTNQAWTLGGTNLYRNAACCYFLPSENEWYKAAYYDPNKKGAGKPGYWLYPEVTDDPPMAVASGTTDRSAVYDGFTAPSSVTQAGGLSPYGTSGQGGNVWQWMESSYYRVSTNPNELRVIRGGGFGNPSGDLQSSSPNYSYPESGDIDIGFRVARLIP
jgi:formylglycine-generating enzyme required for sulfatase activity